MEKAIQVKGMQKSCKKLHVLKGVDFQPVTSIVDASRSLLTGQPVRNDIWVALAWCLGILVVAYLFAMRAYKRKVT